MSKVKMAMEVLNAMEFIGIDKTQFASMKRSAGSLVALHVQLGKMLSGK